MPRVVSFPKTTATPRFHHCHSSLHAPIKPLREENQVLREQLGERRLRLSDDQRRRLAAKAKGLGRKLLRDVATIVTPERLLRCLPPRSPNLNTFAERWVRLVKEECLSHLILFDERSLHRAVTE